LSICSTSSIAISPFSPILTFTDTLHHIPFLNHPHLIPKLPSLLATWTSYLIQPSRAFPLFLPITTFTTFSFSGLWRYICLPTAITDSHEGWL
jgi:hypothetical protein